MCSRFSADLQGGSDSSWASPKDQSAYFKDWSLAVLS